MSVTIDGTNGITTPDITSSGSLNISASAPDNSLVVNSSGNVGIGTSGPASKLHVVATSQTNPAIRGVSVTPTGNGVYGQFNAKYTGTGNDWYFGQVSDGAFAFCSFDGGPVAERMRIDSSGNLLVGTTNTLPADNNVAGVCVSGSYKGLIEASRDAEVSLQLNRMTNDGYLAYFRGQGTARGGIAVAGTVIQYNSFSDYRLKENIQPMQNALGVVQQLNPVTYNWKADGSDGQGFIAHELQAVVPDCVTGEKDAVDDEGKPVYQGIDTSFLVATLTKAIQELSAKNDALEARLAALEAK